VLDHEFDGLIVMDDDCAPPFNAISQCLRRYEAGHSVVLGVGFMRNYPHTTTLGRYFEEGATLSITPDGVELSGFHWLDDVDAEPTDDGLISVDFGGFPIALISREALLKIPRPWFGLELDGGTCTHDVYFGKKCERAGVPIVADTRIKCDHLSDAGWTTFENRGLIRHMQQFADNQRRSLAGSVA
jgi:hypothetical protein